MKTSGRWLTGVCVACLRRRGSVFLCVLLVALLVRPLLAAADHVGRVTLPNGVPVPGARVTATQSDTTVSTTTDVQGSYRFPSLAEGTWTIEVAMVGFSTQRRDVVIAAGAAAAAWELSVMPFAEITRGVPIPPPAPPPDLTRRAAPRPVGRGSGPQDGGSGAASFQRAGAAPAPTGAVNPAAAAVAAKLAAGRGAPPPLEPPPADSSSGDAFLLSGTV